MLRAKRESQSSHRRLDRHLSALMICLRLSWVSNVDVIADWLLSRRGLELHPAEVVATAAPSTYLGFRVSRAGLCPGKKLRRRMRQRVAAAAERGPEALERTLLSYKARVRFG